MSVTRVDRQGLEMLDEATCWHLLEREPVGRLAFLAGRRPVILPVNHRLYDEAVVFRTDEGSKLDAATRQPGAPVAYEVDGYDEMAGTGWSVVVNGSLRPVLNGAEVAALDRLGLRVWADVADRHRWLRIDVDSISGRRILPRGDRDDEEPKAML